MANCNCVKGNFDVIIDYLGCSVLSIEDFSDWMVEDEIYTKPDEFILKITTPNRPTSYSITLKTDKRNKITPSELGLNSATFNDGIYCFTLENCGNIYKRNKLLSCHIECCIDDAVSKLRSREEILLLDEIRLLLDSCKINTEIGNLTRAKEQYDMVTKMLRKLNCNCK